MLTVKGLSKTYNIGTFGNQKLHAVSDINFEIKKGEVLSLIGESGSGKSTIGKMILGLLSMTSGTISLNEKNISHIKRSEIKEYYRSVQGVFQDPFSSFNPIFKADRVFKNIKDEFFPEITKPEWTMKLVGALESVGLNPNHVLNKFPHQLSGGQLQRLLIARALLLNIEFLVADEIISMLDASTRIDVLNLLADLKNNGLAVLFITHDLSLGYYISDRSIILYRGCAAEMGSSLKIYDDPKHPYTKMLMNAVPRLDRKWEEDNIKLKGKNNDHPEGCVYYSRCPVTNKPTECTTKRPPLYEVDTDHLVSCYLFKNKGKLS